MNRYFKMLAPAIFVTVVLLIVFLQFNSNRSIERLIHHNENLLQVSSTKTNLQKLVTGVVMLESKVRGKVISNEKVDTGFRTAEINTIRKTLEELDTLRFYPSIVPLIGQLDSIVDSKISFNQYILETYQNEGKRAAENVIKTRKGKALSDSIHAICERIDTIHQESVETLIKEADANGHKALALGSVIALIAVIASVITFGFVVYKVNRQQHLISRLNESEKKAREAATVKENFLANMSHEIRTPLNAIIGFTNLLGKKEMDKESVHFVNTIRQSGENLLSIVNDVLDLSKIEAGMMRIEYAPFSMRSTLHNVEMMFASKAAGKNLRLDVSSDPDVPDLLIGDVTRLTQILVNLVENAFKFTQQGDIRVNITVMSTEGDVVLVQFAVSDTGIGIEKEKLSKIFERFEQAQESVTREYGGTGLGLSIVRELTLLLNGSINAESVTGKGTTIYVQLPFKISFEKPFVNTSIDTGKPLSKSTELHILAVEDNPINRDLVKHLLSQWNCKCDLAVNGNDAMQLLKLKKYDLILLDIQMPEMDGYTTAQEIRNTLKLKTPVIAMTAHAMQGEREKCLSYGMNEYISKPIREDKLLGMIRMFTKKKTIGGHNPEIENEYSNAQYSVIRFKYLKDVSKENIGYEKTVVTQFIEMVPDALQKIEGYYHEGRMKELKQEAHNMKTTVSILGLDTVLSEHLDTLEYGEINEDSFNTTYPQLKTICLQAVKEATVFYNSL